MRRSDATTARSDAALLAHPDGVRCVPGRAAVMLAKLNDGRNRPFCSLSPAPRFEQAQTLTLLSPYWSSTKHMLRLPDRTSHSHSEPWPSGALAPTDPLLCEAPAEAHRALIDC